MTWVELPAPRWRRVAESLERLAADQAGTPEGDLAAERLAAILRRHPEARQDPGLVAVDLEALFRPRTLTAEQEAELAMAALLIKTRKQARCPFCAPDPVRIYCPGCRREVEYEVARMRHDMLWKA